MQTHWLPAACTGKLVSVVIPTFNRASLVLDTIRSVFAQSYRPLEVLVGDDGSSDDTLARLRELQPPQGVTLQVFGGSKVGACNLRNEGAMRSRGEYLMFLDSDDLLTVQALEGLVGEIADCDIAWGPWRDMRVETDRCTLSAPFMRSFGDDWLVNLLLGDWIATCSVIYRRSTLARITGWREDTALDSDFYFHTQLGAAGAKLRTCTAVTSYYRRGDPDQVSEQPYPAKMRATHLTLLALEQSLDANGGWTPARRAAVAARYFHSARMTWYRTGDVDRFAEFIREALRIDPTFKPPKAWYRWVARLAGFKGAERVAALGRKLFR